MDLVVGMSRARPRKLQRYIPSTVVTEGLRPLCPLSSSVPPTRDTTRIVDQASPELGQGQPDIAHYFAPKEPPFTSLHLLEASVASLNV